MPVGAPAKINLFLHVGDKRADGFHALESMVAFTRLGDTLDVSEADNLSLAICGPFADGLSGENDNLVLRAACKLAENCGVSPRARMRLTKNLPVASGIGGGSADAAAALRGLNELWNLKLSSDRLCELAAGLGSDIPVCVSSAPAWMEGRGERVTPMAHLPEMPIVLVNPGVSVPTGPVFAALNARSGTVGLRPDRKLLSMDDVLRFLEATSNDLEAPALKIAPVIGDVLSLLRKQGGARFVRMSGSGATCFAIFSDEQSATAAARAIQAEHTNWWAAPTALLGTG